MKEREGYTKAELVQATARAGFVIDAKLIDRWVSAGLLDQATPHGRGKGQGVERLWPESQLQLLLVSLDQHRTARPLPVLTNVPVVIWLLWGDNFVPLRQARRALETYSSPAPRRRPYRGRAWVRHLVSRIARPGVSGYERDALAAALLEALEAGRLDDPALAKRFAAVVGPSNPTEQADGPRILDVIRAQWAARARFGELSDAHFRWARAFVVASWADYSNVNGVLAADPRFGHLHAPFNLESVVRGASDALFTTLGLGLTMPMSDDLPPELQLRSWLENRAEAVIVVERHFTRGLLGRGRDELAIELRFNLAP